MAGYADAEEFAVMLSEATSFVLQVTYADRSRVWLADSVRGHDEWRWTTAGTAQDAAHDFVRVLRAHRKRRLLRVAWPMALIIATILMFSSLGVDATGPTGKEVLQYVAPLWLTLLSVAAVITGAVAMVMTDPTGFGRSRRRHLKNLAVPARRFSWRRYFEIRPIDLTNGVFAALLIGVAGGALLVLMFGK